MVSGTRHDPDAEALARVVAARPLWTGVSRVDEITPGAGRALFHAGPPFAHPRDIPRPVLNSLAFGCLYEGWARSWEEADSLVALSGVRLLAAQDHGLLVPLAGVASPSMTALAVTDGVTGRVRHAVLNEGAQVASRLGRRDDRLAEHHRWLNGEFAAWLGDCLAEPVEILPALAASLGEGDDGHAQTLNGSRRLAAALRQRAAATPDRVGAFLDEAAAFALNVWMATVSVALAAAEGVAGTTLVTRAGGNGHSFGYSIGSEPRRWITAPAPVPRGPLIPDHASAAPAGALGDSAVLDFFGLGGMNLATAPGVRGAFGAYLPVDVLERGGLVLSGPHPGLDARRVVTSARRACEADAGPIVLLGMIDRQGEAGRIGGGVVDLPGSMFAASLSGSST